jgi:CheY-like chemotaxis protein
VSGRFRQRAVVLLVEDNPDDVVMIREALEQSLTPIQLYVVSNGEQAIKFVRRTDADAPGPASSCLISTCLFVMAWMS